MRSHRRDTLAIFAAALAARLAVVIWAAGRFPPAGDGIYYQKIAERIGMGLGYTWLWPDGAVTYAAHYPVGYPAIVGAVYAITGPTLTVAMVINAVIGALAAAAVHHLAGRAGGRRSAIVAGALVALHPALVMYTPAIMTEGVTAALITIAAVLAAPIEGSRRRALGRIAGLGAVIGIATLVRPQSILIAPLFALIAAFPGPAGRARIARILGRMALATAVAVLVCAPWTARNCVRMKRCALVSVNGGWNLLIGADEASTGAWSPVKVPDACREVFDEAEKDVCFGREAQRFIREHPATWAALVPRKLAATFDYAGAPGWYLHASNAEAFPDRAKTALGAVETLFERLVLVAALVAVARRVGPEAPRRRILGLALAAVGAIAAFTLHAWVGYLAFAAVGVLRGRAMIRGPVIVSAAVLVVLATAGVHAVFFGAGRYSMVVFPLLTGVAALAYQPGFAADPDVDRT